MLRVAEERATPVEVGHVVQGDDVREAALVIVPAKPRLLSWTRRVPDEGGNQTSSEVIVGDRRSAEVSRGQQRSAEVISCSSYLMREAIRDHQIPPVALSRTKWHSVALSGTQWLSGTLWHSMPIKRQSKLIRTAYLTTN